MTRLSLFSRRSSSVQEIPLWGRPSLMSPLPAPDPTRQQWPNLVWKRATMGEPTGPLISWSPPPTHPTGQRGSSTHTEVHTDAYRYTWTVFMQLKQFTAENALTKQMIAETFKELWQQLPLLTLSTTYPKSSITSFTHWHTHTWSWPSITPSLIQSYIPALFSLSEPGFSVRPGAPVLGVIHTPLPLAQIPCKGWRGKHTHTQI